MLARVEGKNAVKRLHTILYVCKRINVFSVQQWWTLERYISQAMFWLAVISLAAAFSKLCSTDDTIDPFANQANHLTCLICPPPLPANKKRLVYNLQALLKKGKWASDHSVSHACAVFRGCLTGGDAPINNLSRGWYLEKKNSYNSANFWVLFFKIVD